jgi:predicted unusual protein kinase regulating ubiquinone biosynthesis (AarF/ABC1/UbiB family)
LKIILLDHGIYTELTDEVRLNYTKLWRGILSQNEKQIEEAGVALGAKDKKLFTSVITQKKYE